MITIASLKRALPVMLILLIVLGGTRCTATKEELHDHGKMAPAVSVSKDHVYPMSEVNFEKVIKENQGLQVLLETATTANDFYRGGVQEKELGESLLKAEKWEDARIHLEKSNQFLRVVVNSLREGEAQRNIYGTHKVIFMPNLLMADNDLKLASIDRRIGKEKEAVESERAGKGYLSKSLGQVKTEWAFQLQKEFEGPPQK